MTRVIHYVGFRDDRYWAAWKIWRGPRVIHRWWDRRANREIGPHDIVIFATGEFDQSPQARNAPDIEEDYLP